MEMHSFEKWFVNSGLFNLVHTRVLLPKVFALANGAIGPVILEIGCGTGVTTHEILRRFPHARAFAIDYDPEQVETGQKATVLLWRPRRRTTRRRDSISTSRCIY